jgi:DUF971 family protein
LGAEKDQRLECPIADLTLNGYARFVAHHDIESVEVVRLSHVEILFADGVRARFDLEPLRLACPCAECNAKRSAGTSVQPGVERGAGITVRSAEMAGAWGLSLDWSDGHSTGIYAWEKLREWIDTGAIGAVVE